MKPTEYMTFVNNEVNQRFANPQYPRGEKDTRTVPLGNEQIQPNPDGSAPLCLHDGVRIDKVGIAYLCKVRWGVVARGNVPNGIKTLDELAEHPNCQIEFYLSVTDRTNNERGLQYNQTVDVSSLEGFRDMIKTNVVRNLNLI